MKKLLLLTIVLLASACVSQSPNGTQGTDQQGTSTAEIASCGKITENSILAGDITASARCFEIGADNIKLDCNGHKISYAGIGSTAAILIDGKSNVTVSNCKIEMYDYGFNVLNSEGINLNNNVIDFARVAGIKLYATTGGEINSNTISLGRGDGIYLLDSPAVKLISNIITENSNGIKLERSENVIVSANTLCKNSEYDLVCDTVASGMNNKVDRVNCGGIQIKAC